VDGHLAARAEFPVTTPAGFNPGGLTGTPHTVTTDLSGDLIIDTEAEMRIAMACQ
jgi:hypothetical protein